MLLYPNLCKRAHFKTTKHQIPGIWEFRQETNIIKEFLSNLRVVFPKPHGRFPKYARSISDMRTVDS